MAGFVIGIAGGSGSGKSTLTGRLQQAFPGQVAILRLDDYYKSLSHLSLEERARVNFDHPDALDSALFAQHLAQLRQGQAVQVPLYDFTLHDRKKVEDSCSLSALLKKPNRFTFILLGLILTVILLVVCLVLLLRKLVRKLRRRKKTH